MRKDDRTVRIAVPDLKTEQDIRIVTNAALNELVGRYTGKFQYEMDIGRGLVLYHESHGLQTAAYQRRIVECLRAAGYDARFLAVAHNPPAPIPLKQRLVQDWPDRFTAVLHVPELKCNRDADRVEDAIAWARSGDHPSSIAIDRTGRSIQLAFNPRLTALRNIQQAIAAAGYTANDTPPEAGDLGSFNLGWSPVRAN
jgi:copper chaperone CopZ